MYQKMFWPTIRYQMQKDEKPRVLKYCQYDDYFKYLILLKHRNSVHSVMRHIDAVTYDHQANQVAPNKHAKVGAFWGLRRLRAR
jgi:hypothetical protein